MIHGAEHMVKSKLPQWVYKARDAAEFSKLIPRNSPVSSVVHLGMGVAAGLGTTVGMAALLPSRHDAGVDADTWTREQHMKTMGGIAAAGSVIGVLLTAGMQFDTPGTRQLARGINPIYFLGVGGWVGATLIGSQFARAWEE